MEVNSNLLIYILILSYVKIIIFWMNNLLSDSQFQISKDLILKLYSLDKKCAKLHIELTQKSDQGENSVFQQTISVTDVNHQKPSSSILFLKLALECSLSKGYANQTYVKLQRIQNLLWQKIVIGKDKVDAAFLSLNKKGQRKKYQGYALSLSYPQCILIILPKVHVNQIAPRVNYDKISYKKQTEQQNKIKKLFYATLQE